MKIELQKITISQLCKGYKDNQENGVIGYNGNLNIRPAYQREFVYNESQQKAVIKSIINNYPLNVLYWAVQDKDTFEVIDGQQRTLSICKYIEGDFSYDGMYFHNQPNDIQEKILNYELMVYFCNGTDSEKLEWFKIINIAGEKLTNQELRNAVYSGSWLSDCKRYFSRNGCPAYDIASKYLKGSANRQAYLETVIDWISDGSIEEYMAKNQNEKNANELWVYFTAVITWVNLLFPNYRGEMKGIDWGKLYNKHKDTKFDAEELEKKVKMLMEDENVTRRAGIYSYLITGEEKHLSIRSFTDKDKRAVYEKQNGICVKCNLEYDIKEMEADHITPWSQGGETIVKNCQMLCVSCNRRKSNK